MKSEGRGAISSFMSSATPEPDFTFAASEVARELARWLAHLSAERRVSPKTGQAYEPDVRQLLVFLRGHLGNRVTLSALSRLKPLDVREFMASRRGEGVTSRSLVRALAWPRALARFRDRDGRGKGGRAARGAHAESREAAAEATRDRRRQAHCRDRLARRRGTRALDSRPRPRGGGFALRLGLASQRAAGAQAPRRSRVRRGHHGHRQGQQAAHGTGAGAGHESRHRISRYLPL